MFERLIEKLVRQSTLRRNRKEALIALVIDEAFFLLIAPWLVLLPSWWVCRRWWQADGTPWDRWMGWLFFFAGLSWSLWAVRTQWIHGKGTPSMKVPTVRLVTTGPYRYCRNPIQFGALLYVFGLGMMVFSWRVALVALIAGSMTGIGYIRLVEEKELSRRFGPAYDEYRDRTRFLFPGPPRKRKTGGTDGAIS